MSATPGIGLSKPEFSPLSLARAVWKHQTLAAIIVLGLTAGGVVVVRRLPAIYKAEALILVDSQKVPERFVASTVTEDLQERLTTISQEILSVSRLQEIINDLSLYREERRLHGVQDAIEIMRREIEVKVEKGRAFRITYEARDPKLAAEVVNRVTKLYIEQNLKSRETQAEGTTEFIQTQLDEAKGKLDSLEAAVSSYKIQHTGELPQQEVSLSGALSRLQMELQANQEAAARAQQDKLALESALTAAESAEAALKRSTQRSVAAAPADPDNDEPASVAVVQRPSDAIEQELAQLQQHYTDDHPDVRRLKARLAAARRAEAQESPEPASTSTSKSPVGAKKPAPAIVDPAVAAELIRVRERIATLRSQITAADRSIVQHEEEGKRIVAEAASYQRRVDRLPIREQEMAALMRDYEISKSNYRSLLDKKIAAEMASDLERRQKAERFRILDAAKPPEKQFKPNRNVLYIVTAGFALAIGIATAIAKELKSSVLLGEWELPKGTTVLGLIPVIRPEVPRRALLAPGGTPCARSSATVLPALIAVVGCCLATAAMALRV
jgi:polysaccharide chain length determinant protein (PEP-CTERM system associated)